MYETTVERDDVVPTLRSMSAAEATRWFDAWLRSREAYAAQIWIEDIAALLQKLAVELDTASDSSELRGLQVAAAVIRDAAATVSSISVAEVAECHDLLALTDS